MAKCSGLSENSCKDTGGCGWNTDKHKCQKSGFPVVPFVIGAVALGALLLLKKSPALVNVPLKNIDPVNCVPGVGGFKCNGDDITVYNMACTGGFINANQGCCEANGHFWYNNKCNLVPQNNIDPVNCVPGVGGTSCFGGFKLTYLPDCTNVDNAVPDKGCCEASGFFWDGVQCLVCNPAEPPKTVSMCPDGINIEAVQQCKVDGSGLEIFKLKCPPLPQTGELIIFNYSDAPVQLTFVGNMNNPNPAIMQPKQSIKYTLDPNTYQFTMERQAPNSITVTGEARVVQAKTTHITTKWSLDINQKDIFQNTGQPLAPYLFVQADVPVSVNSVCGQNFPAGLTFEDYFSAPQNVVCSVGITSPANWIGNVPLQDWQTGLFNRRLIALNF